jgi:hypothetical protein
VEDSAGTLSGRRCCSDGKTPRTCASVASATAHWLEAGQHAQQQDDFDEVVAAGGGGGGQAIEGGGRAVQGVGLQQVLVPPAGCLVASVPVLVLPAAAKEELDTLLDEMAAQEEEGVGHRSGSHCAHDSGRRTVSNASGAFAAPAQAVAPAPGGLLQWLNSAFGLPGRHVLCNAEAAGAEGSVSWSRAAAWREHWRPLLDDVGFVVALSEQGVAASLEMGPSGASEMAQIATVSSFAADVAGAVAVAVLWAPAGSGNRASPGLLPMFGFSAWLWQPDHPCFFEFALPPRIRAPTDEATKRPPLHPAVPPSRRCCSSSWTTPALRLPRHCCLLQALRASLSAGAARR